MGTKTDHPTLFNGPMILAIMTCSKCGTVTLEIECPECGSKKRRKTQTRRIINLPNCYNDGTPLIKPFVYTGLHSDGIWHGWRTDERHGHGLQHAAKSPLGVPGDLLWTKEPFRIESATRLSQVVHGVYTRDGSDFHCRLTNSEWAKFKKWKKPYSGKSSLFMFKSLCRLWLKVKSVRVERVQEITQDDAIAEGVDLGDYDITCMGDCANRHCDRIGDKTLCDIYHTDEDCPETEAFGMLWDSINTKPRPRYEKKQIIYYESYPWQDIRETREHHGKPWHVIGNPFVFATEFERYSK